MNCSKCKKDIPGGAAFCPWCGKRIIPVRRNRKRANGVGTVFKHPGNRAKPWEAQKSGIYIGTYATKYEAEQALLKLSDKKITDAINLTFSEVYDKWLPEHSRTITAKGREGYEIAYKHCTALYDQTFRKLRTSDFQAVILAMEQASFSLSSCQKVVQLFGQLSSWAIREEITHTNFARFLTLAGAKSKEKRIFSQEEILSICNAESPAKDIALIMLATGCRPNELFSAKLENCKEDYFISGSKTEAGKNRVLPVSAIGMESYTHLLTTARENSCRRLIDAYSGNHTYANFAKRDWKALMEEVGIPDVTPYSCRHTYATLASQAGVKPEILQKIMGHSDYKITVSVYEHPDLQAILEESKKIAVTDTLQTRQNQG